MDDGEARRRLENIIARRCEKFVLRYLSSTENGYVLKFGQGIVDIVRTRIDSSNRSSRVTNAESSKGVRSMANVKSVRFVSAAITIALTAFAPIQSIAAQRFVQASTDHSNDVVIVDTTDGRIIHCTGDILNLTEPAGVCARIGQFPADLLTDLPGNVRIGIVPTPCIGVNVACAGSVAYVTNLSTGITFQCALATISGTPSGTCKRMTL